MNASARACAMSVLALSLAGCYRVFENPVDPAAGSYEGFTTVYSPLQIELCCPSYGESLPQGGSIVLVVSRVLEADQYQVQVSLSSDSSFDESGIVYESTGASNRFVLPEGLAFPGLFAWRACARDVYSGAFSSWVDVPSSHYYVLASGPSISDWSVTSDLPSPQGLCTCVAYAGYVYAVGGLDGGGAGYLPDVVYAAVNADGSLGSWQEATPLPSGRYAHGSVASGGYLYVLGGWDGSTHHDDVLYAAVNADGSLGSWQSTTSLPFGRDDHSSVVIDGYLYVIGGTGESGSVSDVVYAPVNADGSLGSWQATTSLPSARYEHSSVSRGGYLYVIGGSDGGSLPDVLYAGVNPDGTLASWQRATDLPSGSHSNSSLVWGEYVYVLGGYADGNILSDVLYATANADGSLGSWQPTLDLPDTVVDFDAVMLGGRVYVCSTGGVYIGSFVLQSFQGGGPSLPAVVISPSGGTLTDSVEVTISSPVPTASIRYTSDGTTPTPYVGNAIASGATLTLAEPCVLKAVAYLAGVATSPVASATFRKQAATPTFSPASGAFAGSVIVELSSDTTGAPIYYTLDGSTPTASSTRYTDAIELTEQTTITAMAGGWPWFDSMVVVKSYGPEGAVGLWRETTSLPEGRRDHGGIAFGGYLHLFGGDGSSHVSDLVLRAATSVDGTVGAWQEDTVLPVGRDGHSSVLWNGYVYVLGGYNGSYLSDVWFAAANDDGSLGAWQSATSLPSARSDHSGVAWGGYVYVLGGWRDGPVFLDEVLYAPVGVDGTLGSWQSTTSLPGAVRYHSSVVAGDYLYVIGGDGDWGSTAEVLFAALNGDGTVGSWRSATSLPSARLNHSSVASGAYLYVIGGYGSAYLADVLYTTVATDGSLGSWSTTTDLGSPRQNHGSVLSGRWLYTLGGDEFGYLSDVLVADIVQ